MLAVESVDTTATKIASRSWVLENLGPDPKGRTRLQGKPPCLLSQTPSFEKKGQIAQLYFGQCTTAQPVSTVGTI